MAKSRSDAARIDFGHDIRTEPSSKAYRDNWERVFGRKPKANDDDASGDRDDDEPE